MQDYLYKAGFVLILLLILVAGLYAINLYKTNKLVGTNGQNSIVVTGQGKVTAKPDISTITFTVRESGKTVKDIEPVVSQKVTKAIEQIKTLVSENDIKTENYNSFPRYSYPNNGPSVINGYEVSQNVTVKVRNVDNVSKVLSMISAANINEVNGPNYSIDEPDQYKDKARAEAIAKAREKAEKLADQLGVSLGRIISFSESDGGYVQPVYMMKAEVYAGDGRTAAPAPSLPTGENDVVSNVTLTFEIK